ALQPPAQAQRQKQKVLRPAPLPPQRQRDRRKEVPPVKAHLALLHLRPELRRELPLKELRQRLAEPQLQGPALEKQQQVLRISLRKIHLPRLLPRPLSPVRGPAARR